MLLPLKADVPGEGDWSPGRNPLAPPGSGQREPGPPRPPPGTGLWEDRMSKQHASHVNRHSCEYRMDHWPVVKQEPRVNLGK